MPKGFYKVHRRQSLSFCTDTFYNPDTHEYFTLIDSDSDDYEIQNHFWDEHEEPVNEAMWFTYDMDDEKVRVNYDWNKQIRRIEHEP